MRRLLETEIAAVIDGGEAFVGGQGIVDAVIATAAGHQGRDHDFRTDFQRLAHEIFSEFGAYLHQHAAKLVTEREWPGQRLWPMSFENVQVRAADPAGANLDQRRLPSDFRPRHAADDRLRAGPVIGAYADLLHGFSSCSGRQRQPVGRCLREPWPAIQTSCIAGETSNRKAAPESISLGISSAFRKLDA